jgi:hypothetical protein
MQLKQLKAVSYMINPQLSRWRTKDRIGHCESPHVEKGGTVGYKAGETVAN